MMKRYEAMMTYAEYSGEPEATMSQDEHGKYVKAEVAQALYDALKLATDDANKCVVSYDEMKVDWVNEAESALSLANGEAE